MNALELNYWLKQHWKLLLLIIVGVIVLAQTIFQIVYPSSRLVAGTVVDGLDLGGKKYDEAAEVLDKAYGTLTLKIYFGKNDAAFQTPKMSEVGIGVDNEARLSTLSYPFYLRIIPGSIWWAAALQKTGDIAYTYDKNKIAEYTQSKVGDDCSIPPQNASLKLVGSQLQLVPAVTGGKCDLTEFQQALAQVKPDDEKDNSVRIAIDETPAPVDDDMARNLAGKLNSRMATPMPITVDKTTDTIPGRVVLGWLDFKAVVPEKSIDNSANQSASLQFSVNSERMESYLNQGIASQVVKKPGVSKVSTHDFTETSRVNGASGRGLDMPKAVASVTDYINDKSQKAVAATKVVGPTTSYTRTYSPTSVGFRALLTHYAQDNPGTYGLAFTELSGVRFPRSASYNADARIKAGGIHSLYMAYAVVTQEYAKVARPVDIITGNTNSTECFKLMLQRFDQDCIRGYYNYFGHATLTQKAKDLGLKNTVFAGDDTVTSANDLHSVMIGLYKNQVARGAQNGQKILSTIRTTRDKEGIPTGAGSGEISHVIGETDTVYNDTALVYSTNYGAYALTIMSDGASWDEVAGLTKKIADLKKVKIPPNAR